MELDAQVRDRLRQHFVDTNAACLSHSQFDRLVTCVTEIVRDAEAGKLQADRGRTPPPEPEPAPAPAVDATPLVVDDNDGQPHVVPSETIA